MTKEEAIEFVRESGFNFKKIPEYMNDKDVALEAVQSNGYALDYCSLDLKDDFDIVLAAVKNNGIAIKYAGEELQENEEIINTALSNRRDALDYKTAHIRKQRRSEEELRRKTAEKLERYRQMDRVFENIIDDSTKIIEKYNVSQNDALMVMQILELKIQNKKLGDLGDYLDDMNARLDELESNSGYEDVDLEDIYSRLDDIESDIDDLK